MATARRTSSAPAPRLRRSQGFFGLHLDFHAGDADRAIGKRLTPRHAAAVIATVQPDFLQVDCKGHPGRASYLTRVGTRAGGFVRDPLRVWRQATTAAGIPLTVHVSGVWDDAALVKHPSWARVDSAGKSSTQHASVFGPYVDELLIPQLTELADGWKIDAAWIDGDCWSVHPDWSSHARRAWRAQGHRGALPRGPADARWPEFLAFNREGFRAYVRRYVGALQAAVPGFEVASNWAWSSFMPEAVQAPVDFLSGDLDSLRGVDAARYQARCLAGQGRPWDLMAWGFAAKSWEGYKAQGDKTAVQLCQEAAHVIAHGGGFQVYITQNRDASVALPRLAATAEAGRFCRARQRLCHGGATVPQVLLLNHAGSIRREQIDPLFMGTGAACDGLRGWLFALLDAQFPVDIRHEEGLGDLATYPLVVVPEWTHLEPQLIARLIAYVRGGGALLAAGAAAAAFAPAVGAAVGHAGELATRHLVVGDQGPAMTRGIHRAITKRGRGTVLATLHGEADPAAPGEVAATLHRLGRGRLALVGAGIGRSYLAERTAALREAVRTMGRALLPRPLVEIDGSRMVDVVVRSQRGDLVVHLLDRDGQHMSSEVFSFDELRPTPPLTVRIRCARPASVVFAPGRTRPRWTWAKGVLAVAVPPFTVHTAILVRPHAD